MPSALQTPESPPTGHAELLSFLRGRDNPFDVFVAARKPDAHFARYHVPSVHGAVFSVLRAIVDRYRSLRLEKESDVPRSGVLVILGSRGTGKTHTVHALQQAGALPCVVVAPAIYEPHRSFVEYLLHQLVRHLQNEGAVRTPGTLDSLADVLARNVLAQAFYGMTEIDWLARHASGGWRFWQYLFGVGTKKLSDQKRLLIKELVGPENRTIQEVCERCEEDRDELLSMALEHVERFEAGHTIAGQIRRGLYAGLVRRAFGQSQEEIYEFLLDGYTRTDARTQPSRETLVEELFRALTELCLLARTPVLFAFDALESLLGDPPDGKLAQPFFRGQADVLDSHRGIPYLIFAEQGHWDRAQAFLSDYVRHRFQQGVMRVPNHGTLSVLRFPPLSMEQLRDIVAARMKPLLAEFYESEPPEVPAIFPFTEEDLKKLAREPGSEPPLRQALQSLRDRYEVLLNGRAMRPEIQDAALATLPAATLEVLESSWQRELRAAKRKLDAGGLAALADELHDGIVKWFEAVIADGMSTEKGKPVSAANQSLGNHPTYGQLTIYEWEGRAGVVKRGLGLLLGERRGMPNDLETKLKMAALPAAPFEVLVLLWPRGADLDSSAQALLTGASKALWDRYEKAGHTGKVRLEAIAAEDLMPWLALPTWMNVTRTESDRIPPDVLHHFITEKTETLLKLVSPRE